MSHVLSEIFTAGNAVIDLRRAGITSAPSVPAPYYKACRISVTAIKTGGAAATFSVAPVVVADDAAAPSSTSISVTTLGNPNGVAFLDSVANPSLTIGQVYSKGYSSDVFSGPVATHLMVTCTAPGGLQIIVD